MVKGRGAFTLIEVMVAVLIITTVIMALITMSGNNTHYFSSLKNKTKIDQYASLFISNTKYGLENEDVTLDKLVDQFDIETDLRRELKAIKVNVNYQVIDTIDMSEFEDTNEDDTNQYEATDSNEQNDSVNSNLIIEIGKTVLRVDDSSVPLVRIQIKWESQKVVLL